MHGKYLTEYDSPVNIGDMDASASLLAVQWELVGEIVPSIPKRFDLR